MTFGQQLQLHRVAAGLSQGDVADLSHCDRSHVSRLESGERQPSVETMRSLGRALCLSDSETRYLWLLVLEGSHDAQDHAGRAK